MMRWLTAIPVYNEAAHLRQVLAEVRRHAPCILVIDDGSTDATPRLLHQEPGIRRIVHESNRGYGAALASAFSFTLRHGYDVLVTMDCDGQHQPDLIPSLLAEIEHADIVSGSRYLRESHHDMPAPSERRAINRTITRMLNERYGLGITDAFCGFKAYRRGALERIAIREQGWGMPLELWVQAARLKLRIREVPVPRVYLDPSRTFGGTLDDPTERLAYYKQVIEQAEKVWTNSRFIRGANRP